MKTKFNRIEPNTINIDISGMSLGRAANQVVRYLLGKFDYRSSAHLDKNTTVLVHNLNKATLKKDYCMFSHSGYPKGSKLLTLHDIIFKNKLDFFFKKMVYGMMPKTTQYKKIVSRRVKIQNYKEKQI